MNKAIKSIIIAIFGLALLVYTFFMKIPFVYIPLIIITPVIGILLIIAGVRYYQKGNFQWIRHPRVIGLVMGIIGGFNFFFVIGIIFSPIQGMTLAYYEYFALYALVFFFMGIIGLGLVLKQSWTYGLRKLGNALDRVVENASRNTRESRTEEGTPQTIIVNTQPHLVRETCPRCRGTGYIQKQDIILTVPTTCPVCKGRGWTKEWRSR